MSRASALPLSDDDLNELIVSDHRLIARLATEPLACRRELGELRRLTRHAGAPPEDDDA